MTSFFTQHAIDNVWCNPDQDSQFCIAGHRVTPDYGAHGTVPLFRRDVVLPENRKTYHVYNIGHVYPALVALLQKRRNWAPERWVRIDKYMNEVSIYIELITQAGLQLARSKSWYMFTKENALIYATEVDKRFPVDLNEEKVFFRLYDNAYFQSSHKEDSAVDFIHTEGIDVKDVASLVAIREKYREMAAKPGLSTVWKNGTLVSDISAATVAIGDYVEFVHDTSFKKRVIFPLPALESFNSTLDNEYKYLVHYEGSSDNTIDYIDDIEFEVTYLDRHGRWRGRSYPCLVEMSKRMLTHRDYSVPVPFVTYICDKIMESDESAPRNYSQYRLHLKIRKSGYLRNLVYEANKISELYKLTDQQVVSCMTGHLSSVPFWHAAWLEESMYVKIMGMKRSQITTEMVEKAYGYNSLAKSFADSPIKLRKVGTNYQCDLPYGLSFNATIYEYDENGHYLGNYRKTSGTIYVAQNPSCRLIEGIVGFGQLNHSVQYGIDNLDVPHDRPYRVYMSFLESGESNGQWEDITGTGRYRVEDGKLIWNETQYNQLICIKSDETYYSGDYDLEFVGGVLSVDLVERVNWFGESRLQTIPFPGGDIDVILHGRSLIKGLDYKVQWPKIIINNRDFIRDAELGTKQRIHVRMTGFCSEDMKLRCIEDFGFIEHGLLSENHRYDVRDDKVLRITVGGSTKHRDDLRFAESGYGEDKLNASNGTPYQVKDMVVSMFGLSDGETSYSLREKSLAVDNVVSDFMTRHLDYREREDLVAIPNRYRLVSPFFSRIIYLTTSVYTNDQVNAALTDQQVRDLVAPHIWLLDSDPLRDENMPDDRYVEVVPHFYNSPVSTNIYKYRFLDRVKRIYGNGRIDIQSHVTINQD